MFFVVGGSAHWIASRTVELDRYERRETTVLPATIGGECLQCLVEKLPQVEGYTLCHITTGNAYRGCRTGDRANFTSVDDPNSPFSQTLTVRLDEFHRSRPESEGAAAVTAVESLLRANAATTREHPVDREMRETAIEALRIIADEL